MTDDRLLAEARDAFALCEEAESENRLAALDDLRFAKLGEQWPESVRQQRIKDGRPCLTINRQPAFIRQVVNEARQNRPSILVHPVDSVADPAVAQIYNGLIRNIEQTSKADVAYDTAVDCAVSNGFGYFRISESEELGFHVVRDAGLSADFGVEHGVPFIRVSETNNGLAITLLGTLAHEMIHLRQHLTSDREHHGPRFRRIAAKVCAVHGFDPKTF